VPDALSPTSGTTNSTTKAALLDELGRVRRMALLFGILSGVLMIATAALLALLLSR